MKDGGLPADSGFIHGRWCVHQCAAVKEQPRWLKIAILGGYVQQRRSFKQKAASTCAAAVKLRESAIEEGGIAVQAFSESVEAPAQEVEHTRQIIPGGAARSF